MIKIEMTYPNQYFENYYYITENGYKRYFIYPVKELEKYQKNIVSFKTKKHNTIFDKVVFRTKLNDFSNIEKSTTEQFGDAIIVFEFPDDYPEEDLFYFKMKYC